jgi:hypothetical protein
MQTSNFGKKAEKFSSAITIQQKISSIQKVTVKQTNFALKAIL